MAIWDGSTGYNEYTPVKIGDRVAVNFYPNATPLWRGYLVAVVGNQMCILGDSEPNGQPVTFRLDQVMPENATPTWLGVKDAEDQLARLKAKLAEKRPWWRAPRQPSDQEALELAALTLQTAILAYRRVDELRVRLAQELPNSSADIREITEDGMKRGDPCMVKLRDYAPLGQPAPWVTVQCKFVVEFRGWRFVQFPHGGCHGYPSEHVKPKKRKQRVVKLPPLVVRDLSEMK